MRKHKQWKAAAIAVLLAGLAGCASQSPNTRGDASGKPQRQAVDATQVDRNGDKMISREEAAALPALAKEFDRIDANRDSMLDEKEVGAYHHGMMGNHHHNLAARFQQADTNGDGALTLDEAKAGRVIPVVHHFDQLDVDKDGKVSMDELNSARMQHGRHGGQCGGHAGKHGDHGMRDGSGSMSCGHGASPARDGSGARAL